MCLKSPEVISASKDIDLDPELDICLVFCLYSSLPLGWDVVTEVDVTASLSGHSCPHAPGCRVSELSPRLVWVWEDHVNEIVRPFFKIPAGGRLFIIVQKWIYLKRVRGGQLKVKPRLQRKETAE